VTNNHHPKGHFMAVPLLPSALQNKSLAQVREAIASEIKSLDKHPFSWCLPATLTTDLFVSQKLPAIINTSFNPGQLEINLRAVTELIERVAFRRSDLVSLEERAINTFLDYQFAASIQPLNLTLANLALKANRATANANDQDAGYETLEAVDRAQTEARTLRLVMHNTPGHPLNYGSVLVK
jgi:hypothetical protein